MSQHVGVFGHGGELQRLHGLPDHRLDAEQPQRQTPVLGHRFRLQRVQVESLGQTLRIALPGAVALGELGQDVSRANHRVLQVRPGLTLEG